VRRGWPVYGRVRVRVGPHARPLHLHLAGDRTKEALLAFADALVPSAGQPHRKHHALQAAPKVRYRMHYVCMCYVLYVLCITLCVRAHAVCLCPACGPRRRAASTAPAKACVCMCVCVCLTPDGGLQPGGLRDGQEGEEARAWHALVYARTLTRACTHTHQQMSRPRKPLLAHVSFVVARACFPFLAALSRSQVPGTLHFAARSEGHSFEHNWMNMTHLVREHGAL
jgi:hypothetical protein